VLPEFVDRARALRALIERATPAFDAACERVLRPLTPRPAWPEPGRGNWYKPLVNGYRRIRSPCRLDLASRIEGDGSLVLTELRVAATTIKCAAWSEGDELALSVGMTCICTHPYRAEHSLIADVGLHALARRFQRGWAADAGSVLVDLVPLGYGWARTVKARGEFRVEAPLGQGHWVGAVSKVADRPLPVLLVRSFIGE
jgi:hypothetical protein